MPNIAPIIIFILAFLSSSSSIVYQHHDASYNVFAALSLTDELMINAVDGKNHDEFSSKQQTISFDDDGYSEGCNLNDCSETYHFAGYPVILQCSVANGELPAAVGFTLPLYYPGNFELCNTFRKAHFCTINTGTLGIPADDRGEVLFPLGPLYIGKCIPKTCSSADLKKSFVTKMDGLFQEIEKVTNDPKQIEYLKKIDSYIKQTASVHCVDDGEKRRKNSNKTEFAFWVFIFSTLLLFVFVSSIYDYFLMQVHEIDSQVNQNGISNNQVNGNWLSAENKSRRDAKNRIESFLLCFSLFNNLEKLLAPVTGDFLSLNGIRVISMMWIIYGHTVLESSGVTSSLIRFNINPTAVDEQVLSSRMLLGRGAEYAVDTFFFMSGFLAMWGMLEIYVTKDQEMTLFSYINAIFLRYIRLTPVYAFVILFFIGVFNKLGTGPLWDANLGGNSYYHQSCSKYWWTNLLYINDFYPPDTRSGIGGCLQWTWYLGDDMMFFLLIGPFCLIFKYAQRRHTGGFRRLVELYGPCAILVVLQVSLNIWTLHKWDIRGSFDDNYNVHLYVKPWTRMSPYVVGMALAMYHHERIRLSKYFGFNWKKLHTNPYIITLGFLFAFSMTTVVVVSLYDQFRCKENDTHECKSYYAFIRYGVLRPPNWIDKPELMDLYYGFTYLLWSLAIAYISYYLFCGYGKAINNFLSHPFWTPFARLTYNAYLVHMIVMYWYYYRAPNLPYFSVSTYTIHAIAFIVIAYSISFFLFLLIERPVMNLSTMALASKKKKERVQNSENTENNEHESDNHDDHAHHYLDRETRQVSDVDSEALILAASPNKVDRNQTATIPLLA